MLTYKAMYKYLDEGVHAEVLDFPGVISFGKNLEAVSYTHLTLPTILRV